MKGEKTMEGVINNRPPADPVKWNLCAARVALDLGDTVKADEFICAAIQELDMDRLRGFVGQS